ncbi:MAG: hypothetical protein ABIK37_05420 [candidate division WOR-3 bacterium]
MRLEITDTLLRQVVSEVGPLVEAETGWPLEPAGLSVRAVPKERGYEEIVLGRLRGAGVRLDEAGRPGLPERLLEYVVEANVLAAYEPSRGELIVVRENVDDSNLDGLRLVVGHELVHRAQHVRYPELFSRLDSAIRSLFDETAGLRDVLGRLKAIQPLMSLIESHAWHVQENLRRTHFPGAVIERHFNIATVLMRVFGARKVAQYRDAVPEIAAAAASGGVDGLFERLRV